MSRSTNDKHRENSFEYKTKTQGRQRSNSIFTVPSFDQPFEVPNDRINNHHNASDSDVRIANNGTQKMIVRGRGERLPKSDVEYLEHIHAAVHGAENVHSHIVPGVDAGGRNDYRLVVPFIPGEEMHRLMHRAVSSLQEELGAEGGGNTQRIKALKLYLMQNFLLMAKALQHMHSVGVIHLDANFVNAVVAPDFSETVLIDLDLSTFENDLALIFESSKQKDSRYFAPERFAEFSPTDERPSIKATRAQDVFSLCFCYGSDVGLGVSLQTLLGEIPEVSRGTARNPAARPSLDSMINAVEHKAIQFRNELYSDLPSRPADHDSFTQALCILVANGLDTPPANINAIANSRTLAANIIRYPNFAREILCDEVSGILQAQGLEAPNTMTPQLSDNIRQYPDFAPLLRINDSSNDEEQVRAYHEGRFILSERQERVFAIMQKAGLVRRTPGGQFHYLAAGLRFLLALSFEELQRIEDLDNAGLLNKRTYMHVLNEAAYNKRYGLKDLPRSNRILFLKAHSILEDRQLDIEDNLELIKNPAIARNILKYPRLAKLILKLQITAAMELSDKRYKLLLRKRDFIAKGDTSALTFDAFEQMDDDALKDFLSCWKTLQKNEFADPATVKVLLRSEIFRSNLKSYSDHVKLIVYGFQNDKLTAEHINAWAVLCDHNLASPELAKQLAQSNHFAKNLIAFPVFASLIVDEYVDRLFNKDAPEARLLKTAEGKAKVEALGSALDRHSIDILLKDEAYQPNAGQYTPHNPARSRRGSIYTVGATHYSVSNTTNLGHMSGGELLGLPVRPILDSTQPKRNGISPETAWLVKGGYQRVPANKARNAEHAWKALYPSERTELHVVGQTYVNGARQWDCRFIIPRFQGETLEKKLTGLVKQYEQATDALARCRIELHMVKVLQLAEAAVSGAHAKGIVHGDVKPDNIIISDDGKNAHLIDFIESAKVGDKVPCRWKGPSLSPHYAPECSSKVAQSFFAAPSQDVFSFCRIVESRPDPRHRGADPAPNALHIQGALLERGQRCVLMNIAQSKAFKGGLKSAPSLRSTLGDLSSELDSQKEALQTEEKRLLLRLKAKKVFDTIDQKMEAEENRLSGTVKAGLIVAMRTTLQVKYNLFKTKTAKDETSNPGDALSDFVRESKTLLSELKDNDDYSAYRSYFSTCALFGRRTKSVRTIAEVTDAVDQVFTQAVR